MIVLNRIDSRLIHGQIIEAWLPHLNVRRVVVADDEASADPLTQAAYGLAVPDGVEVLTQPVLTVDYSSLAGDRVRTLVLFRTVQDVVRARGQGLPNGTLNVGNVHSAPGRVAVTRSVFLDAHDTQALGELGANGMQVVIQTVPSEKPAALPV